MSDVMWALTRSSGVVALALILVAVGDGLIFSGREGRRPRPAWWLDLHRGVGGYALIFTVLHVLTAFLASDLGVGLADALVPGASATSTTAFTLGVLALYGIAITVLTTWPKRRLRRPWWHALHLLSIPALVAAAIHAYQLGSDATNLAYLGVFVVLIGLVTYPLVLRVTGIYLRWAERRPARPATERRPVTAGRILVPGEPLPPPVLDRELVGAGPRSR